MMYHFKEIEALVWKLFLKIILSFLEKNIFLIQKTCLANLKKEVFFYNN